MSPKRSSPVPEWVPADLPAAPGVYQFEDALGAPIYVGKSVNLKRRVRGYFYGGGPESPRMAQMVRLARGVSAERAGSDLEARLEEAERIERHRPPFNRALKNRSRGWYLEIDWGDPFPRIRVVSRARRSRAQYFGPFRGRRLPAEAVRLVEKIFRLRSCAGSLRPEPCGSACLQYGIGQCTAPCVHAVGIDSYRRQVREAARLLAEPEYLPVVVGRFRELRDRHVAGGTPEEAAGWQRRLAWLDELDSYRQGLERPWVDRSWLIVLPGPTDATGVLLPVARGRVLPRRRIAWSDPRWRAAVEAKCYAVRLAELRAEAVFPPAELTPSMIVTSWLEAGAPEGDAFDLDALETADVLDELARC